MGHMQYAPESEIEHRIQKIQGEMRAASYDGLLVVHHTNLFYFSGTSQDAHLFIPSTGQPILMVKKSYERACRESSIKKIIQIKSLKEIWPLIKACQKENIFRIGMELDVIPYNTVVFYQNRICPGVQLIDASILFRQIRLIKSDYEIERLRHSCHILDQAFAQVPTWICPGMPEIELASLFEAFMRKNGYGGGCKVRAFNRDFLYGNLVSGTNGHESSYFDGPVNGPGLTPANNPSGAGWKKIGFNEPVYIDYTCVINGYTADAERIFAMGKLDDELVRAHSMALEIQDKVVSALEQGQTCSQVWDLCIDASQKAKLLDHFMGMGQDRVKFVGHGVGLELDEMPVFAKGFDVSVEKGMTFALEPKFVFDHGAVGIENTFAVTEKGIEKLNTFDEEICYI